MKTKKTKESLIASTQELLWKRGYVGMSPKAILKHSGVGQGSLYHHFAGKAELSSAAIRRSAENLEAQATTQLMTAGTAIDKIMAFLQRKRDVLRGCPIGRLAQDPEIISIDMLSQPLAESFESIRQQLIDILTQGIARHELHEDLDVRCTADLILSTLQGGYVLARAANSETPFHNAIQGLKALLSKSVQTRA